MKAPERISKGREENYTEKNETVLIHFIRAGSIRNTNGILNIVSEIKKSPQKRGGYDILKIGDHILPISSIR